MTDNIVLRNHDVFITDGKITSVSAHQKGSAAENIIDGNGKYLMPGLWDSHAHMDHGFSAHYLAHGITAVRDCGNDDEVFALREDASSGRVLAPRLFVAGKILEGDPPLWPQFKVLKTEKDVYEYIDFLVKKKVDHVKVYHTLPPKLYTLAVALARENGLQVAGHIPDDMTPIEALDAGVTSIEHLMTLGQYLGRYDYKKATEKEYEGWWHFIKPRIDSDNLQKLRSAFDKYNAYFCPTLIVHKQLSGMKDYAALVESIDASLINNKMVSENWNPDSKQANANIRGLKPLWWENYQIIFNNLRTALPELAKHARILAGSDTMNPFVLPGSSLLAELELLADSGLSNFQVLQAATVHPASYFGLDEEMGKVHSGASANLILLDANPLDNISNIRKLHGVYIHNSFHSQEVLKNRVKPLGK